MYDLNTVSETPSLDQELNADTFNRGVFGLPADAIHELNAIADGRPVTDHDLDQMWAEEMERRDRESAARPKSPVAVVDVAGKRFKAFVIVDGRKKLLGTFKTESEAWRAASTVQKNWNPITTLGHTAAYPSPSTTLGVPGCSGASGVFMRRPSAAARNSSPPAEAAPG